VVNGSLVAKDAPAFDSSASLALTVRQTPVQVVSGRLAFIAPKIRAGHATAFGLKIAGSNSFFTIKALYGDTAIAVYLPPTIKAADTIRAKYWAYDETGLTSNAVDVNICTPPPISEDSKWLLGKWTCTLNKQGPDYDHLIVSDTFILNQWVPSYKIYNWGNNLWKEVFVGTLDRELGGGRSVSIPKPSDAVFVDYIDQTFIKENSYTFSDHDFRWYYVADHNWLDLQNSKVGDLKHKPYTETQQSQGSIEWQYYSSVNMLVWGNIENLPPVLLYGSVWYPEKVSDRNVVLVSTWLDDTVIRTTRLRLER